jgi:hypothetical protein
MTELKTKIGFLSFRIEVIQEKMDASLGEMKAWRKETMVCQEGMTAC